jgi:hypothetical protein
MGGKKGGFNAYVKSWTNNPLENLATGGNVALYKGTAAGLGVKAPTSSSIGAPELFAGPDKVKGFQMPQNLQEAEMQAVQRQAAIAAGAAPSIAQMAQQQNLEALNRQAQSLAASQRGSSNPALAFRQAQISSQQAGLESAQQGAIMAEQERRVADDFIARQAAASRGVAFQQESLNKQLEAQQRAQNLALLGNIGAVGAKVATGAYTGGVVDGDPKVKGDSPQNDTEPYMLSPGEIVIPRSAAKDKESAMKFLDAIKFENEKNKGKNKEESSESEGIDVASMARLFHEMTKLKGK